MSKKLSFATSLDWLFVLLAIVSAVAVVQTFIFGKHYIIPSALLFLTVLFAHLGWYGLHNTGWAKRSNFWLGFLFNAHCFFALFWSVKYRELLGANFEWIFVLLTLVLLCINWLYALRNQLFKRN